LLLEKGLDAQRIWQDLRDDYGFTGSYDSVKRYIRKEKAREPVRIYRIESLPGEEAQVDFGTGAWIEDEHSGKKRRSWLFRIVLSCSRKGYTESVYRQNTETFIRCLENAFRYFGGVPQTINLDNLRAAVSKADWYEPEINPKLESFAQHYGTQVLPCRPYTPEHKGKVESGVKYVKNNAIKGRSFCSLSEQNAFLLEWEAKVADCRIHGTTRKQVGQHFVQVEKDALLALPASLFPCFNEGQRKVHRDSYVEVDGSYYEVPQEYRSQQVWVRWDARTVRIYNRQLEHLRTFAKANRGQFSSSLGTRGRRASSVEQDAAWWIRKVSRFGSHCGLWAIEVVAQRGAAGIRVLQGLNALGKKYSNRAIDQACEQAIGMSAFHLKEIKALLVHPQEQENFTFMDKHPLIREMSEYTQTLELLVPQQNTERY
jgi:transposase